MNFTYTPTLINDVSELDPKVEYFIGENHLPLYQNLNTAWVVAIPQGNGHLTCAHNVQDLLRLGGVQIFTRTPLLPEGTHTLTVVSSDTKYLLDNESHKYVGELPAGDYAILPMSVLHGLLAGKKEGS